MRKLSNLYLATAVAAVLALSGPAAAQMGGGMGGSGGGMGGGMGSGGMGGSMGSGGMGSDGMMGMSSDMMGAGHVLVTPEGNAVLVSRKTSSTAGAPPTAQVVALAPSGSVAWRWDAGTGVHQLALATGLVLVTTGDMSAGSGGSGSTPSGALVALRSTVGTEAWRYAADGMVGALEVSTDRIYAVVMKMASTTGGGSGSGSMNGSMSRTLVVLDLNGHVLWTFVLDA